MNISSQIDKLIFNALMLVNQDKYQEAQAIVQSILNNKTLFEILNTGQWQFISHISLAIGKLELAKQAYIKSNSMENLAFTLILENELEEAKRILLSHNNSRASYWYIFLINLFSEQKYIKDWPTFFLIRNFMEFTVYYLLLTKNHHYINLLLAKLHRFLEINSDSEKLIGYAYFHFGKLDEALLYLNHSIKREQYDGEVYYKLGQIYLVKNSLHEALSMLHNAQLFLPHHYPTKVLVEKVSSMI